MNLKLFMTCNFFFARMRVREYRSGVAALLPKLLVLIGFCLLSQPSYCASKKFAKDLRSISDPKLEVCLPAIEALGATHNKSAVPSLANTYAKEPRALVRRTLIDALGRINHSSALPTLTTALNDSDVQVRQSAVAILGHHRTKAAQDALLTRAAAEQDPAVKTYLANAVGRSNDPRAKAHLDQWTKDGDPEVRRLAREALEKRSRKDKK